MVASLHQIKYGIGTPQQQFKWITNNLCALNKFKKLAT